MAISLTDSEEFLPYIKKELEKYAIPYTVRIGKSMGKYLSGRLFAAIQDCYKNNFSFISDFNTVKTMDKSDAIAAGLYNVIGDDVDDAYIAELKKQVINPEIVKEMGDDLVAVFTPLHGTGNIPARRVLKEIGLNKVYVVKEQELPDGDFPTVGYPNPEDKKAFELALKLGEEVNADVVLATDPDADRLGVYAKDSKTGEYMAFTGNM